MIESNHVVLWNRCLDIIKDNVPDTTYNTWFAPIVPLKYEDKTLYLQIPSQFFYEILEERFVDLIRKTLYKVIGEGTKLMYNVMVDKTSIPNQTVNLEASNRSTAVTPKSTSTDGRKIPTFLENHVIQDIDSHLNPNYNFENFIEGYSNKLSRSVAEAVAEKPGGTAFNPLFLYGASGVGKTHLANAIGTKIKELYPQKSVLYVSAHLFQVQYTESVRTNTTNDFIRYYQNIDVLIIDDIQEFAGVTKTQNNFFHIFNHLHQNGKQLILTSDRAPVLLQGIEERLLTRFKWGMVAELEKPTVELRKNILRNKIHRDGLQFPEEVIDYIAENVNESVRDLEGIVIAIMAILAGALAPALIKYIAKSRRSTDVSNAQTIATAVTNALSVEAAYDAAEAGDYTLSTTKPVAVNGTGAAFTSEVVSQLGSAAYKPKYDKDQSFMFTLSSDKSTFTVTVNGSELYPDVCAEYK